MRQIRYGLVVCASIVCLFLGVAFPQQQSEFESLLAAARQAQARGDFEVAAGFYDKAVTLQPEIAELRANLGLMYYQTGKDQQAIAAFLQAIRLKPDLFVPNLFLGLDYLKLKRFQEAIPYLKRATVIKPADVQAHLALGQAQAAIGETRLAITSYSRAEQADPGNADVWFNLGVAYLEQVEANARVMLARHKDSGYLHALVADTFAEQRAYIQAAAAYKTALASQAFPYGTHSAYAFVLLGQRDFSGAERELHAELASNPDSLPAKLGLARLHLEQGQARNAVVEIVQIWKANAGFLRANIPVFKRGLSTSKLSELQRSLEEGRATGEIPEEVVFLFETKAKNGKIADLSQSLSPVVDTPGPSTRKPGNPAAKNEDCIDLVRAQDQQLRAPELRVLASCAYLTGQYYASFAAAQKLAVNPVTEAEGLYWETRSAQRLATEALARASTIDSDSPTLHVLLGDIYRQRKYYPDAEQEYRKALVIRPQDTGALLGLSLALLADSEIEGALHIAQAGLRKNPEDPEFNAVMGEILSAQHDYSGAEPYLEKALTTKPELVPHVHALLGRVYAETNRTQQAIAEMRLGLSDDKDGRLHYQIARLFLKVGDGDSARRAFEESERLRSEGLTRAAVAMQQGEYNSDPQ